MGDSLLDSFLLPGEKRLLERRREYLEAHAGANPLELRKDISDNKRLALLNTKRGVNMAEDVVHNSTMGINNADDIQRLKESFREKANQIAALEKEMRLGFDDVGVSSSLREPAAEATSSLRAALAAATYADAEAARAVEPVVPPIPEGPGTSRDPKDTQADWNDAKWVPVFKMPTEKEYQERCGKPTGCRSECQEADKINREKCNLLRKRVVCGLRDAGCPSIVQPTKTCDGSIATDAAVAGTDCGCGCVTEQYEVDPDYEDPDGDYEEPPREFCIDGETYVEELDPDYEDPYESSPAPAPAPAPTVPAVPDVDVPAPEGVIGPMEEEEGAL